MDEKVKVLIMRQYKKERQVHTMQIGSVELDINVGEVRRVRGWRKNLRHQIEHEQRLGAVDSINVLAQPKDGHHVVVTLKLDRPGFERKKPMTRGGRPIEGPIPVRTARRVRREGSR